MTVNKTARRFKRLIPSSPAFIIDKREVINSLTQLQYLKRQSGCKILYSIKSLPLSTVLQWCASVVDGYSVSSLFEARLADEISAGAGSLHLTTPGLTADEIGDLSERCRYISFNSLNQYRRLQAQIKNNCSPGLRVNPKLSFIDDDRYDPCRSNSKLGVPLDELSGANFPERIQGLHFHTVFSYPDFEPLMQIVAGIRAQLADNIESIRWLNLGGGYLFNTIKDYSGFIGLVKQLRQELNIEIFIEPGNAIINAAGYLLSTVIDCFNSDGKNIAVLDTSVNHNPEVFEYQKKPALCEACADGKYTAVLAGCTCLAGDLFGEYKFNKPLQVGDRVVFHHVGAYSLVKANRFNGYNLPDIYSYHDQQIELLKQYTYKDYYRQWVVK